MPPEAWPGLSWVALPATGEEAGSTMNSLDRPLQALARWLKWTQEETPESWGAGVGSPAPGPGQGAFGACAEAEEPGVLLGALLSPAPPLPGGLPSPEADGAAGSPPHCLLLSKGD